MSRAVCPQGAGGACVTHACGCSWPITISGSQQRIRAQEYVYTIPIPCQPWTAAAHPIVDATLIHRYDSGFSCQHPNAVQVSHPNAFDQ